MIGKGTGGLQSVVAQQDEAFGKFLNIEKLIDQVAIKSAIGIFGQVSTFQYPLLQVYSPEA